MRQFAYLAARDQYQVEREDKAGRGYVDFIFYPYDRSKDGIILELKVDHSPEEAISKYGTESMLWLFRESWQRESGTENESLRWESLMILTRENISVK